MPKLTKKSKATNLRGKVKGVSEYQVYEIKRIKRNQVKGAPYNPRLIDKQERKKLEKLLEKHGLVEPLVYNKRTNNIVAGHQRIEILDALHGNDKYILDWSVIDVDPKKEAEINISLNQKNAMGEFDEDKLRDMKDLFPEINFKDAGFDEIDVNYLWPKEELKNLQDGSSEVDGIVNEADAINDEVDKDKEERIKRFNERKEQKNDATQDGTATHDMQSPEFYSMIIFESPAQKQKFNAFIGKDDFETYVPFSSISAFLAKWKDE